MKTNELKGEVLVPLGMKNSKYFMGWIYIGFKAEFFL